MLLRSQLLQYQADFLNIAVERPADVETTASGAAIAAGLGAGVWHDLDDLTDSREGGSEFMPRMSAEARNYSKAKWAKAVEASFGWAT